MRNEFNQDHIGRQTRQGYVGHRQAATSAANSAENWNARAQQHANWANKVRKFKQYIQFSLKRTS